MVNVSNLEPISRTRGFDVFVSYAHEDAAWVRVLASRLHNAGLEVFLDEWRIAPGDVVALRLEEAIQASRNGIVVFSPASVGRPWVTEEYAALIRRAVAGSFRFIPVIYGDCEIPTFAASRLWVDFRGADGTLYEARVSELLRGLAGEPARAPPGPGATVVGPPGSRIRPEGPRYAQVTLAPDRVVFQPGTPQEAAHFPALRPGRLSDLRWQFERMRRLAWRREQEITRESGGRGDTAPDAQPVAAALHALGTELGEEFFAGAAGVALAEAVASARALARLTARRIAGG